MTRRRWIVLGVLLAGLALAAVMVLRPRRAPAPKPFPKVVVTTTYIEGVAPTVRRKIRVVDGNVEPWMLDGVYPRLTIPSLAQYLEAYAKWEKTAKIHDGKITVYIDSRVSFALGQEVIETCRAAGYPTADVVVATNGIVESAGKGGPHVTAHPGDKR